MWRRCSEASAGARVISIGSPSHDIPWHAADTAKLCASPPTSAKARETHQWWGTFRVGGHSTSALFTEHTTAAVGGQARAVESAAVTERGKRERRSPHLSRHLSELEDLRIIEVEWQGTRKHHSLNSAPLARLLDGRQSRFIQPCPDRVLCHEHRQSNGYAQLCERWRRTLRGRQSGADLKPPQAAAVKSRGGERCGNAGTRFRQARSREASASEPLQKCRNRIR